MFVLTFLWFFWNGHDEFICQFLYLFRVVLYLAVEDTVVAHDGVCYVSGVFQCAGADFVVDLFFKQVFIRDEHAVAAISVAYIFVNHSFFRWVVVSISVYELVLFAEFDGFLKCDCHNESPFCCFWNWFLSVCTLVSSGRTTDSGVLP